MAAKKDTIFVRQIRSAIRRPKDQGDTLRGLGLRKIRHERELEDTPEVRGMIIKIDHLVEARKTPDGPTLTRQELQIGLKAQLAARRQAAQPRKDA